MSAEEKPTDATPTEGKDRSPLSAERLRAAFSQMLGKSPAKESTAAEAGDTAAPSVPERDPCEINPQSIVEAMLFVGRPDDRPYTARELAATMRGVSPKEVEEAARALNTRYDRDGAPYRIVPTPEGLRFRLREQFAQVRYRVYDRSREAKLTGGALEVLSLVAYQQPITVQQINEQRGSASGSIVASLLRRKLLRLERPADRPRQPDYYTTDRFLEIFGLGSLEELPRSQELNAA